MNHLELHKFSPLHGQVAEDVEISISKEFPKLRKSGEGQILFNNEGIALELALYLALPQGTYEALLREMLKRKASFYIGQLSS